MNLNITAYSTALFSTWYFIDEWGLLFDCGDGVIAQLLHKSRKVKHIFISHADRDHVTGLLQFVQLNSREGLPKIYYPKDSGSFPHLAQFSARFDPHANGSEWHALDFERPIFLQKTLAVRGFRNEHIPCKKEVVKSMGFHLERVKRKLKAECLGKSSQEIIAARNKFGEKGITTEVRENILSYSGDTPIANDKRFENTHTLIHEATFLEIDEQLLDKEKANKHSTLPEVLAMVAESNVRRLILGHFSSRYDSAEIDKAIRKWIRHFQIQIPVFRILPGKCVRNVLGRNPINE